MRFFLDNNLPPSLAQALDSLSRPLGHQVLHLAEKFTRATPDHEWIASLAHEGDWVLITQDRLKKNDMEKRALRESNLTAFFLKKGWSDQKYWDKAWRLVRWWPLIIDQADRVQPGATFYVPLQLTGKGKFEQFNY